MSGTPINLNRARKARDKVKKRAQADENAVKFGRTKAEKSKDTAERDKATRKLDQHRRDT
ncbi:DUF4169 family protein [Pseudaestuariivita atlantica]|uniref:Amidase n=1 Tax=Pseudaestuariivita atlantica TaxID=1317121 RepID=A0A0L1JVP4_9RHOB|nr:DUF4169 family protein [Pseudaestuariivita atlantica]KNG95438.1 amidase [Pseudaestuariivita atlantica]